MTLLVEFFELLGNAGIDPVKILFEILDVGFEIGLVVVSADQMKDLLSDREYVGTATVVFLESLNDQRGAAGLRDVSGMHEHNPKRRRRFDALRGDCAVARLEYVQRDRLSGEENNAEREKWDARDIHRRGRALLEEGRKRIRMCLGSAKKCTGSLFIQIGCRVFRSSGGAEAVARLFRGEGLLANGKGNPRVRRGGLQQPRRAVSRKANRERCSLLFLQK